MSDEQPTEACGRCSMTTVVDAVGDERPGSDPFAGDRIEVDESSMRRISPVAWTRNLTTRLNEAVQRLTYGR